MKLTRATVVYWVNPLTNELHKGALGPAMHGEIGAREFFTNAQDAVVAHLEKRAVEDNKLRVQVSNQTRNMKGTSLS